LVDFALVLGVFIPGHLAESLFGLAAYVVNLIAGLVLSTHDLVSFNWLGHGSETSLAITDYLAHPHPKPIAAVT
jgi:hypothetical protein